MESKVKKVIEALEKLSENESYLLDINEIEEPFVTEVGYFAKNGKGKYAIRVRYGITTILKIRNSAELEAVKAIIDYLDKKEEILKALDRLNNSNSRKTTKKSNILRL